MKKQPNLFWRIIRKFGNAIMRDEEKNTEIRQLLMKKGIEAYMKEQNLKICKQCQQEKLATSKELGDDTSL